MRIDDVPGDVRHRLAPILEQSFTGIYRWHASRTLRSVDRVRAATSGNVEAGLAMFTMLEPGTGYIYYVAVLPSYRALGVGGVLLDDGLKELRNGGAQEVFACIRASNAPSIRLFRSRGFVKTGFRDLTRQRGLGGAVRLWRRMVAAPGENVYRNALRP